MTQQPSTPAALSTASVRAGGLRAFRRVAIIVIIVSLSLTAVIGIITLITGSFGEVQSKIMLTTLIIGATSVVALCDLAVLGRRVRIVGITGLVAAAIALVTALSLVWGSDSSELVVKIFALAAIAAGSIAHASLLLLLSERRRSAVRTGLWITVALIALLLVLLYLAILSNGDVWGNAYAKLVGTVAILDVLGTIVVPVVSLFLRDGGAPAVGTVLTIAVPPALAARLSLAATEAGTTADELAVDAIARALDDRGLAESAPTQ
ncbi:MAG: hypothetical protein ABI400_00230 [Lacisediminihabitans sp.]